MVACARGLPLHKDYHPYLLSKGRRLPRTWSLTVFPIYRDWSRSGIKCCNPTVTLRIKCGITPKKSGIYPNPAAESNLG